ncbi:carbonic anhydrase [Legionella shakespearei]|uniref:carbonic anhydrase n=1 Tax=Legionella shakespearei DSM 23087 TaxID=1122169 RepID=A0A0W0YLE5_9GAMM|nr:carbonic anhydrase [Legionella shakespearei]KTD57406.1 carbonic anhydrase [Legionella shakespearei DSM 23087]
MLIKLMLGVLEFKRKDFKGLQNLFEQLSNGQHPETLFITCADSRVDPLLITHSLPGQLFVTRNIGNIVPPFPSSSSESAAIEYALSTFNIKDIIICGHSQCGAMNGLLTPDIEKQLPTVASWLSHSQPVLKKMNELHLDEANGWASKLTCATQLNIVQQVQHLKTYPVIVSKLAKNEVSIHGWLYEFETGKITVYDQQKDKFVPLEDALTVALNTRKNKIVSQIAMDYLNGLGRPRTAAECQQFMQLLANMKDNIQPIWEKIKELSRQKLWAELGGLYEKETDEDFITLLNSGSETQLPDLSPFQKNISESKGYRKYCSRLIHQSLFFKPNMTTQPLPHPEPVFVARV